MPIVRFQRSYECHPNIWAFKSKKFIYEVSDHIHQRYDFDLDKFRDDLNTLSQSAKQLIYYTCNESIIIQIKDGHFIYTKNSELGNRLMFTINYSGPNKEAVDTFIDYLANIEYIDYIE